MTSCGRGRDSATLECFGRGYQGTIFVRSSKLSLSLWRVMSVSKSFSVSRAFQRFGAKCSSSGAFGLDDVLGLFLKTPLRHRAFLGTLTTTTSISWKFSFLFSKAEAVLLAWQLWRSQLWAKHFGDGTSKTRMKTRLPGVGEIERRSTIDRRRDWYESCAMIHGPEEKKTQGNQRVIVRRPRPFIICKPASFVEPVSKTGRRYRFALRCFRGRRCTAAGRSGCSAGTAKKSSLPWRFRCWSLRRNELECTKLVHLTGALHRFSSRDAIIVVGSVLEKHFDGDFTPDQEKEITFKRWPPGYQSWKLGLALNGLIQWISVFFFFFFFSFILEECEWERERERERERGGGRGGEEDGSGCVTFLTFPLSNREGLRWRESFEKQIKHVVALWSNVCLQLHRCLKKHFNFLFLFVASWRTVARPSQLHDNEQVHQ